MKWNPWMFLVFEFITTSRATNQFQEMFRNPFEPSTELSLKVNSCDNPINSKSSDGYTGAQEHDLFLGSRGNAKLLKNNEGFQQNFLKGPAGSSEIHESSISLDLTLSTLHSQMDINFQPGKTTQIEMHDVDKIMSKRPRNQSNLDDQLFKSLSHFSTESRKEVLQPGTISTTLSLMNPVEKIPSKPIFPKKELTYEFGKKTESSSAMFNLVASAQQPEQQRSRKTLKLEEDLLFGNNGYVSKSMGMYQRGKSVAKENIPRDTEEQKKGSWIPSPTSMVINQSHDPANQDYTKDRLGKSAKLHHSVPNIQISVPATSSTSISPQTVCPEATKYDHERLNFGDDIFQMYAGFGISEETQICHINHLNRKIQAISNPPRDIPLGKTQLQISCDNLLQRTIGLSSENIMPVIKRFAYPDMQLLKYLNLQPNIYLKSWDFQSDIYCFSLPYVFPLYIIYIEMIIGILPTRREKGFEQILDYPTEMENAVKVFQEFESYLKNPESATEAREFWKEKSIVLLPGSKSRTQNEYGAVLWHCIEVWVEKENPLLWSYIKNQKSKTIHKFVKTFFNNVFFYGIIGLTRQIKGIVDNSSKKAIEIISK